MATSYPETEEEGGLQEKKEEEKEQEKAEMGGYTGEKSPKSPATRTPLSWRGKARSEGPVEVKLELHPLQNRWALWFFKNDRSRAWHDNLQLVTKFDTVEDFWAIYSHIKLASKLSPGCDYALFKLLCLIGESFEEHSREVCGAVLNIRAKGDKIAVWTREAEDQASVMHIGRVYKEYLGLSVKTIIGYQAHIDTATKSNSLAKNKFVV
ncbi:PREDICTED: eukaryotic translation initiation factor 4E type 1B isoform X2 [Chinchilla lanigera]|uniref:eukaryotic translation initiation factor 4E type 1B isoform X2 n=1 Tax=Chinchilla lanigera TaxID=34839 RepID=UPI00069691DD|nr:PREDICTED: eukaryotic translation initiation factor 4E type 1B isoform X2 [Chinchilla lanigera]